MSVDIATEKDRWELIGSISDTFKDIHGIRPHGVDFSEMPIADLSAYSTSLQDNLDNILADERAEIDTACKRIGIDRATYNRWLDDVDIRW